MGLSVISSFRICFFFFFFFGTLKHLLFVVKTSPFDQLFSAKTFIPGGQGLNVTTVMYFFLINPHKGFNSDASDGFQKDWWQFHFSVAAVLLVLYVFYVH